MYNVRDFGATATGNQNDQPAIQAAVDACSLTGGTVVIPPGDYLSSTVRLASNVRLQIETGARLLVSTEPRHYSPEGARPGKHHLFEGHSLRNVSICGGGVIDGQATEDYGHLWGITGERPFSAGVLFLTECDGVDIRDLRIRMSGAWTLHLRRCADVVVRDVRINNHLRRIGCDGIDIDSCSDVLVSGCRISTGDDCIVLKTTTPTECKRIVISDCILESKCTALKIGSETLGDFSDVKIHSCVVHSSAVGIGLYIKDGGIVDGVSFSDISVETMSCEESKHPVFPVFMDTEKRHPATPLSWIRNVVLSGIQVRSGSNILIQGMPDSPVQNLQLRDVSQWVTESVDYSERYKAIVGMRTWSDDRDYLYARVSAFCTLAHVYGLSINSLYVNSLSGATCNGSRALLSLNHVRQGRVTGVGSFLIDDCDDRSGTSGIYLHGCSDVTVVKDT